MVVFGFGGRCGYDGVLWVYGFFVLVKVGGLGSGGLSVLLC